MGGKAIDKEGGYGFSIPIVATEEERSGLWSFEWKEKDWDKVEQEDEIDTKLCSFPPLVRSFLYLSVCLKKVNHLIRLRFSWLDVLRGLSTVRIE